MAELFFLKPINKYMKAQIAFNLKETRRLTWQNEFPAETVCVKCGVKARLGFVAYEGLDDEQIEL